MCFFLSHSFVALAVSFGSFSCWNTNPRPIFSALVEAKKFSLKRSLYLAPSIFLLTRCSRPVSLAEKQPQSIMFPPSCLMVGRMLLGFKSAFFLQIRRIELMPKSSISVSSDRSTFSQTSFESSRWLLANFRRACTCALLSRGP